MLGRKANIAVFVSGGGTNLQALIDAQKNGEISSGEIRLVVSSNNKAFALERARTNGIETLVLSQKDFDSIEAYDRELIAELEKRDIDLIVLAGFMTILSENFVKKYPQRIINVHPSLIPSFCGDGFYGLRVHEAALEKGVKITGATVHFVNEITDDGKIIAQKSVEVLENDTPQTLQKRVMEQAEWCILKEAVENVCKKIEK